MLTALGVPQKSTLVNEEAELGVLVQDANTTKSTPAFAADEDKIFGTPIVLVLKHLIAADVAYDAAGAIVNAAGTKTVLGQSYRILSVETNIRVLRTGGTPDHDFKLEMGDGAASEVFASTVATVDIDAEALNTPIQRILVPAEAVWATGTTLRSQVAVSGVTTGATAELDVVITLIPTN